MSLSPSSTSSSTPEVKRQRKVTSPTRRRIGRIFFIVLLVIGIVVAWQFLNAYNNSTDPTVTGRPLSNPHTHLHTIVLGERPGVVYLGTHYGLFTSTDGGRTWPQSHGTLNNYMITAIAVSPSNPNSLALIVIPTSGTTWAHRWHFDRGDLISLVVDPLNPLNLYAGFFQPPKVVYSTDGGSTWQTLTD